MTPTATVVSNTSSPNSVVTSTFASTHQLLTVHPKGTYWKRISGSIGKNIFHALILLGSEENGVTVATGWQNRGSTNSIPVVAIPIVSTSSGASNNTPTVVQTQPNDTSNQQETSIFIEAMEAIFNSQM